jgi:uncharacterized membrane protein
VTTLRWSQRLLAIFFTTAGALHFLRPRMYEQIVPDYMPAHHAWGPSRASHRNLKTA